MDETYVKVKGEWLYYYRAVDISIWPPEKWSVRDSWRNCLRVNLCARRIITSREWQSYVIIIICDRPYEADLTEQ